MSEALVYKALVAAFEEFRANRVIPQSRVAYENRPFDPPAETYYELIGVDTGRDPVTLGEAGEDRMTGFFQINVVGRAGASTQELREAAAELTAFFVSGKMLARGSQVVHIRKSQMSGLITGNPRVKIAVTVFWWADINRDPDMVGPVVTPPASGDWPDYALLYQVAKL